MVGPGGRGHGRHLISDVARIYDLHPQTLRLYERLGLLRPGRSRGNTRLYTRRDLRRLETILDLTRKGRVNLAGVGLVLDLRERVEQLEREVDRLSQSQFVIPRVVGERRSL
jgi:MerR family transcriptional regulator/heat shock protein HspR